MSSLLSNYIFARIFWVSGLVFLLLMVTFAGVSKVLYPMNIELDISEGAIQFIGILQLFVASLLLWKPYRRLGIALAGVNFLTWGIWLSTIDVSMVAFCFVGLSISCILLFGKFNFHPPKKEPEPSIEELVTGSVDIQLEAEVETIEEAPKESLWMDGLGKDDLMQWVFGEED